MCGPFVIPNLPRTWRKTVTAKGKRPRKKRMEERIPMKREDLKAFNLSDEDVQKIMDLHGADIEKQKRSIETLTAERDDFKSRLEEANGKLEGYDPEWKTKAEQAQTEADAKVNKIRRGYLLKEAAGGIKFSSESAKKGVFYPIWRRLSFPYRRIRSWALRIS